MGPEPVPVGDSELNFSEDDNHALSLIIFSLFYKIKGERATNGQIKYLYKIFIGKNLHLARKNR
jgi:hypothetical protein